MKFQNKDTERKDRLSSQKQQLAVQKTSHQQQQLPECIECIFKNLYRKKLPTRSSIPAKPSLKSEVKIKTSYIHRLGRITLLCLMVSPLSSRNVYSLSHHSRSPESCFEPLICPCICIARNSFFSAFQISRKSLLVANLTCNHTESIQGNVALNISAETAVLTVPNWPDRPAAHGRAVHWVPVLAALFSEFSKLYSSCLFVDIFFWPTFYFTMLSSVLSNLLVNQSTEFSICYCISQVLNSNLILCNRFWYHSLLLLPWTWWAQLF